MRRARITSPIKNLLWVLSGVIAMSVVIGVSFGTVKRDKYLQGYDINAEIFDKATIQRYLKIESKENIKEITNEEFGKVFQKERSLDSEILNKYTTVTKSSELDNYSIRIFNFIANKTDNTFSFMIQLRNKQTKELFFINQIISGFKYQEAQYLTDEQVDNIKINYYWSKESKTSLDDFIKQLNSYSNITERTKYFLDSVRTSIIKGFTIYVLDDAKKIDDSNFQFSVKYWNLKWNKENQIYIKKLSKPVLSKIDITKEPPKN